MFAHAGCRLQLASKVDELEERIEDQLAQCVKLIMIQDFRLDIKMCKVRPTFCP